MGATDPDRRRDDSADDDQGDGFGESRVRADPPPGGSPIADRLLALLAPRRGDHVLDVGCGTGEAAQAIARIVGIAGWVLGVDRHESVIAAARQRAAPLGLPLGFLVADSARLTFPDGAFDAVRVDRVLQRFDDPAATLAELVRVTRPGGTVVVAANDWGMASVDAPDEALTRRLLAFHAERQPHGWLGRQLPRHMLQAGLTGLRVDPYTIWAADPAAPDCPLSLQPLLDRALAEGSVTPAEAAGWWDALAAAGRTGHGFCAVSGFVVAGTRPIL